MHKYNSLYTAKFTEHVLTPESYYIKLNTKTACEESPFSHAVFNLLPYSIYTILHLYDVTQLHASFQKLVREHFFTFHLLHRKVNIEFFFETGRRKSYVSQF